MYDFKAITVEKEKEVVSKFKEHNRGVIMDTKQRFSAIAENMESKWNDVTDAAMFSDNAIKEKMRQLGARMNNSVDDPILGDSDTAFTVAVRNKRVKFTFEECYIFLRAALKERKDSAEYAKAAKEAAELKKFIEANKSTETKLAEATAKLASLTTAFGEEVSEDEA